MEELSALYSYVNYLYNLLMEGRWVGVVFSERILSQIDLPIYSRTEDRI